MSKSEFVTVPRDALTTVVMHTRSSGLDEETERKLANAIAEIVWTIREGPIGPPPPPPKRLWPTQEANAAASWRRFWVYVLGAAWALLIGSWGILALKDIIDAWLGYPP